MPVGLEVYSEYMTLTNDQGTRSFICLPVEDRTDALGDITTCVSSVLQEFRQPAYYEVCHEWYDV
jgi:hypothetical protein